MAWMNRSDETVKEKNEKKLISETLLVVPYAISGDVKAERFLQLPSCR